MHLHVGTSGYSYKEWKGSFYPDDIKNADMLRHYGERLGAVEINNTFYRLPRVSVLDGWAEQVPDTFRFSIKASRKITHFKRLKPESKEETDYLLETVQTLGPLLGVVLFQLPPNLKKDTERLAAFLEFLPNGAPAAFEFRHDSWKDDEVYDLLRSRGAAWVCADVEDDEDDAAADEPVVSTADWGYLRLRRPSYDDADLERWVGTVADQGWERAFVFFKHEDEGAGPRMASRFLEIAGS
ncbi:MAG: DUF72 domain-containing protein [Longimicrobiales bacterium]